MYKYNSFYEIYERQLLKARVFNSEKPKAVSTKPPSLDLSFTWV